ncbi:MAG: restriction endonuclease [Deltaproteobacteria bacterium]
MAKPKVTRTYGPIHFEDLDPHRFEDLIREMIYDYKDWQSIEATGRSGSDEGFDIRAYEKAGITSRTENENGEEVEEVHPMEGNLWMIQGKREKEIGPTKVRNIIAEVDEKNPPYGYILAASANFSKESYDVFREELRNKGVMEFYLWGKAELEDMLHLPKNDRILFTFFGISLVSKRRSRSTEIRSIVGTKNKLYKVLGEGHQFHQSILIRDLKDTRYPYKKEYRDFQKKPRWKEYIAFERHPIGLFCHNYEYFAYVDTEKKEYDFTNEVNLVFREVENDKDRKIRTEKIELIKDVWDFFPKANQGHFLIDCLVHYADIAVIDDKGDELYNFPHLYVDFVGERGPFAGFWNILKIGDKEIELIEDYKRINIFPKKFEKSKFGKIHKEKNIVLDAESLKEFKGYRLNTLYESDGKYNFLSPRDIIPIASTIQEPEKEFIQITHKLKTTIKKYVDQIGDDWGTRRAIKQQLGREFSDDEEINVYEFKRTYKRQFENSGKDY